MTGYQEILTDPSYSQQIICMTVPHLGNTGSNLEDIESKKLWCKGFVVRELCDEPSNWRSKGSLEEYLIRHNVTGLCDVDTRALTRYLRTQGVAQGVFVGEKDLPQAHEFLRTLPPWGSRDLIAEVSTPAPYMWIRGVRADSEDWPARSEYPFRVIAVDFGIKWNLLRSLEERGCCVKVVPASTPVEVILKAQPNGIFLSNGPGDPMAAPYAVDTVRSLLGKLPIFGVCMGHQILGLAVGAKTYKLKFGHRGGNQPVADSETGKVEISSHNHGYAISPDAIPANMRVTHWNLNDKTIEGIEVPSLKAFSVQYHPESNPGPHDSKHHFDRFVEQMKT